MRADGGAFVELAMYQRARDLTNALYALTRNGAFGDDVVLASRLRCAALSVMSHIAGGFEHGTTSALVVSLCMAKSACGDVRANLQIACDQGYVAGPANQRFQAAAHEVSRMIAEFVSHLQGSEDIMRSTWARLRSDHNEPSCATVCPAPCSSTSTGAPVLAAWQT